MTPPNALPKNLDAWTRRLNLRRGLVRAGRATLAVSLLIGALIALAAWIPAPSGPFDTPQILIAAIGGLLALLALVPLLITRFTRREAAQIADLVQHTHGLFITAEDALHRREDGEDLTEAERACLERATEHANTLKPADIAPMRFGPRWLIALAPIAAAAAVILTPLAVDQTALDDEKTLTAALKALEKLPRDPKRQKQIADEELTRGLRRLKSRLKKGELNHRQAMEALGDLKSKLRTERRTRAERNLRASKSAQDAARELGRAQTTSRLSQQLAQAARAGQSPEQRQKTAQGAADAIRKLDQLTRQERQDAAKALESAAKAAQASGDDKLAQAMNSAAQAARAGDGDGLEEAAGQLQQAMNQNRDGLTQEELEQLAQALDDAQRQLSGGQQMARSGQPGKGGDESQIAPGPRDWKAGPGRPGEKGGQRPGTGHSDEEAEGEEITDGHQDADRFSDKIPEEAEIDYQELYEAMLLGGDGRIDTRVKGERDKDGRIDSLRGGQQAPRAERARRVMEKLPLRYAREADEAIGEETIPPAYRDAVRDYFDAKEE